MRKILIPLLFSSCIFSAYSAPNNNQFKPSYPTIEMTVTPEEARNHYLQLVTQSIQENIDLYRKSIPLYNRAKASYLALKQNDKRDEDKFYDARANFNKAKKSMNYYYNNLYYLESHLYDLERKNERNSVISKRLSIRLDKANLSEPAE